MASEDAVVLGMGGWGTALANLLATQGRTVWLWGRDPERAEQLRTLRRNEVYLPNVPIAETVIPTADLACVRNAPLILFVAPSRATHEVANKVQEIGISSDAALVSATKGFEFPSGRRISEILHSLFPQNPVAVLSGPNHAEEVGLALPTASVLGGSSHSILIQLQRTFSTASFRTYTSDDVTGIELGGALKNVYALAAGVCDGLKLGDNSKAALVTRCLTEMIRLGVALGGKKETFQGLSGIGDLMVTCFSKHSRNRRVGERLGRGETLLQIRESMRAVAEGIPTTETAFNLARLNGVSTPVLDQVYAMFFSGQTPEKTIHNLMTRHLRSESDDPSR